MLTWNLYHCRDGMPGAGPTLRSTLTGEPVPAGAHLHLNRKLTDQVARLIAAAAPDLCALQEVPPGEVRRLARATGMSAVWCLTGPRVGPAALRARLGARNPDLWRTHEGNANAVLVGRRLELVPGSGRSVRHVTPALIARRARSLGLDPAGVAAWAAEPRRLVLARARAREGGSLVVASVHAHHAPAAADLELRRAAGAALGVAGDDPLVVAGDLNVDPATGPDTLTGLTALGLQGAEPERPLGVDRILFRGLEEAVPARRWAPGEREVAVRWRGRAWRVRVSDHDPVEALLRLRGSAS